MSTEGTINVVRRGNGPAVVLTHGWQNDLHVWDAVVDELAADHTCVAWDLPGHGASAPVDLDVDPGGYSRETQLAHLDVLVGSVGGRAVLVGHSLGGYLSLAYALTRPDAVAGLGLVATGPGFKSDEPREAWNDWVRTNVDASAPPGSETISLHTDAMVIERLGEVTVPAAVIVGERDRQFLASASVFEKKLGGPVTTTIVPDAGHGVHRRSAGAVVAALRDLLPMTP